MAAVRAEELTLKSPADKKSYRLVTLGNGLQALLVHDPEIDLTGAAAQPAGLPPHAEEPSEEDVDSLLSGDEGEESGSEVRQAGSPWALGRGRCKGVGGARPCRRKQLWCSSLLRPAMEPPCVVN